MNKLALIVTLLALAGCVQGQALNELLESMEIEELADEADSSVANEGQPELAADAPREHLYFRDFCVKAEDEIKSFVQEKLNGAAAKLYTIMLTSATDAGSEVLRANAKAVLEGTQIISQEAPKVNPGKAEEVDENVEQTIENLSRNPGLFQRIGDAVKMVIGAVIDTARSTVFKQIAELKEEFGSDKLRLMIEDACASVSGELQSRINRRLTETKSSLKSELAGQDSSLLASLQAASPNNVGCTLSGRVYKVSKFCDILKVAAPAIYQLVGLN